MTADAVAVVRSAWAVIQEEGPPAVVARYDEFMGEDFEWKPALIGEMQGGKTYRGREGWVEYWEDFTAAFADPEYGEAEFTRLDDNRVLVEGLVRLTGTGSGVPIERRVSYVFRVENGLINEGASFFTRDEALESIRAEQGGRA